MLNLALPTLASDLHASTSDLQWFVDAYSLVLAAALLPAGLLGDRFGRKKLLILALVVCSAWPRWPAPTRRSSGELIAARAVLGLAAAVILPLSLAVIPVLFTPAERPRPSRSVCGATFLGYPIGPLLGGWLLDHFWWGSVFLINVPVVVIALIARDPADAGVPQRAPAAAGRARRADLQRRPDALTYGVIKAGQDGWSDATALATMAGGARDPGRVRGLGAARSPAPGRPAAGRPDAVPVGGLHLGHDPVDDGLVRAVRDLVRDAAVLPGRPRPRLARQPGCGCCR